MEFLYVFTLIFISTFGLAMLLYLLWYGFPFRRNISSAVVVPVYEQQDDIERLVKLLTGAGVTSVILMDFGATEEQRKLCGELAASRSDVYCSSAVEIFGKQD